MLERFDTEVLELIPHRPPMLLINRIVSLSAKQSQSIVLVDEQAPFFEAGHGVPAWIGLEYMGQTAALIAGFQQRAGISKPHLGFLMGSRKYETEESYFSPGQDLLVSCEEAALVGESLATFRCTISEREAQDKPLASAMLSVFRKPISE